MNAVPNRVPPAIGERSPYSSRSKGSCSASSALRTNATIPTSSTPTTPRPISLKKRASARGGSGPRTMSSRKPSPPTSSASARKYAQRTRCSVRVGPEAPYASVGGGAETPTPNVQRPETTWPSDESARQRTV
jgi:hypothetical protein